VKSPSKVNVLVVGDIMLDTYIIGEVERISPEAPVPILEVKEEFQTLGGCGNVVRNLREIGASVTCLSVIANDKNGNLIEEELNKIGATSLLYNGAKTTTTKERIIASARRIQMLRVDREKIEQIEFSILKKLLKNDNQKYDIIIVSDYAKGVISKELISYLIDMNSKVIIDPKPKNVHCYRDAFIITPNKKEFKEIKFHDKDIKNHVDYILETRGREGMILHGKKYMWKIKAQEVEVYNVSGAGDTVVASLAICISMGWDIIDSAVIANRCAGYVVTKTGTSTVPKHLFEKFMTEYVRGGIKHEGNKI